MGGSSSKSDKHERKASKRQSKRESKKQKKSKLEREKEKEKEVGVAKTPQAPPPATPSGGGLTYEALTKAERKPRLEEEDLQPVDVPYLTNEKVSCEVLCGVCQVFTGAELSPCEVCGGAFHDSCLRKVGGPALCKPPYPPDTHRTWACFRCRELSNMLTEEEFSGLLNKLEKCGITKDVPVAVAACLRYVVLTYESHVGADMTEDQVETEMAAFQRMAHSDSDLVAWNDLLNYEALKVLSHRNKNSLVRLLTKMEIQRLRETFRKHDPEGKGQISAVDAKNSIQRSLMELVNAGDKKLFQEGGRGGVITWADFLRNNAIYMLAARISLPAKVLRPSIRRRAAAPCQEERPTSFPLSPATSCNQATPPPASLAPPPEIFRPTRPVSTPPASPIPSLPSAKPRPPEQRQQQQQQQQRQEASKKTEAALEPGRGGPAADKSGGAASVASPGSKPVYQASATAALRAPCGRSDGSSQGSGENVVERSVLGAAAPNQQQSARRLNTRHSVGCLGMLQTPYLPSIAERSAHLNYNRRSDDGAPRPAQDNAGRVRTRWSDPRLSDTGLFIREMKEKFNRLSDGQGDATPVSRRGDLVREVTPQRRGSDSRDETSSAPRHDVGGRKTTTTGDDTTGGGGHRPLGGSRSCGASPAKENLPLRGGVQLRSPGKLPEPTPSPIPLKPIGERLSDGHGSSVRVDFLRDLSKEMSKAPRSSAGRPRTRGDRNSDGSDKSQRNSGEAARYDAVRVSTDPDSPSFLVSDGHVFFARSPLEESSVPSNSHGAHSYSAHAPAESSPAAAGRGGPPTNGSPHGRGVPLRPTTPGRPSHALRAHTRSMLLSGGVKLSPPEVAPKPPQGHGKRPLSMAL